MPGRVLPLVTGEIYHVFNRGIDRRPTFRSKKELERAQKTIEFYRFQNLPTRLSKFLILSNQERDSLMEKLLQSERLIDVICYCLMPNHFHLLLKQRTENGISKFLSNFQNSYTKYSNIKEQRIGPLFLDQFKAVRIETDEQFLHVSRYIHLNPFTSYLLKTIDQLKTYRWSSFPEYLDLQEGFCQKEELQSFFKTPFEHEQFVFNQADYQRRLGDIKHLTLED